MKDMIVKGVGALSYISSLEPIPVGVIVAGSFLDTDSTEEPEHTRST